MSKIKFLILLSCLLLVTACSLPALQFAQPATPDVAQMLDAARTEAALTVTAGIIDRATQSPVPPYPLGTMSATIAPTTTPLPSNTPQPSLTNTPTVTRTATITRTATRTPLPGGNPKIEIVGVEKNQAVSIKTINFPANQIFTIRIGPFSEFSSNNKVTGSIYSGSGGPMIFTVLIPSEYIDVDKFTIRLDSNHGYYAFNAFENVTSGTVSYTATPVPTYKCEVSISPSLYTIFPVDADFDAVWEVKNTGDDAWEKSAVDYKYDSGTEMQKYGKVFDLPETVDPGESITIVVDMVAPGTVGTYSTTWVLADGGTTLCKLPLTIVVK